MAKNYKYNAHVCISGIPAYETMIKNHLNYIAEAMPLDEKGEGKFWNHHMDGYEDHCPGIVMIGRGDVCALHVRCCLNPLTRKNDQVSLSTWCVGGTFSRCGTWEESIKRFNDELGEFGGSTAILGYIIFAEDKIDNEKSDDQWIDHIDLPEEESWVDHIDLPGDPVKKSDENVETVERRRIF